MPAHAPLPDLTGKHAVVTGASAGIGKVTAIALARAGARVWLACRSRDKTQPVLEEIGARAGFLALDLASLASVRTAAAAFLALDEPLHLLINNAGLAGQRGESRDGFELAFGVNHLGHFLFTTLLLERMKASAPARIVNVASGSHYQARRGIDWARLRGSTRTLTGLDEYATSKLANVLFTRELARRLCGSGVTTYCLHPGMVASEIWRHIPLPARLVMQMFMKTPEAGARTTLWCASAAELAEQSGRYYDDCRERRASRFALDDALAAELWQRSEAWCAQQAPEPGLGRIR